MQHVAILPAVGTRTGGEITSDNKYLINIYSGTGVFANIKIFDISDTSSWQESNPKTIDSLVAK